MYVFLPQINCVPYASENCFTLLREWKLKIDLSAGGEWSRSKEFVTMKLKLKKINKKI